MTETLGGAWPWTETIKLRCLLLLMPFYRDVQFGCSVISIFVTKTMLSLLVCKFETIYSKIQIDLVTKKIKNELNLVCKSPSVCVCLENGSI